VSTWLTVATVAEDLGFSARTVSRWIERGDLPAVRLPGGRLRISEHALSAFLADRATIPGRRSVAPIEED
jgi:excisionase family DNA binding protein